MRLLAFAIPILCAAQTPFDILTREIPSGTIAGAAALSPSRLTSWGSALHAWNPATLKPEELAPGPFGEGGCIVDLDRDGAPEIILVQGAGLGRLVRFSHPYRSAETIDTGIEMHDCLEATLFGRRGLLIIQRGMQVRFYQRTRAGAWTARDIYSIYTPSYQGGLALADIDRDGFPDIFCGNYWIRSPRRFDLPWRLFAINTWFEFPDSATFRLLALDADRLVVAQAHTAPARFALFRRPSDPVQQWPFEPIEASPPLAYVHALALWRGRILAGERNSASSRLLSIDPASRKPELIGRGRPIVAIVPLSAGTFFTAGPSYVARYSSRR